MRLSLIAAASENGVIGRDNRLPWHLPSDLRRFKRITLGHPVIMGRKTYESIGRPLPGRRNLVISRSPGLVLPGVEVVGSLEQALAACAGADEAFVIGGAQIYELAAARADRVYLTRVHVTIEGDAFFPAEALRGFCARAEERHPEPVPHSFIVYERT